ncbi:zinc finger protein OZF-like isoform X4 [Bradysia coprophila]|uniref:zinc finger protein OZF-like isoform X4 n=1 Tax=Bradysia coprophila TaxID=38358 RepID=UPI00187D995D|nr:zinc finger protein OZF-like isoform X4 [Bradysia coprophila]
MTNNYLTHALTVQNRFLCEKLQVHLARNPKNFILCVLTTGHAKMVLDIEKGIHSSNQNEHVDDEVKNSDDDDGITTYVENLPPESRPYVCPVCGKRYVQKYFLIAHMDIHNYEKKFECYICKQSFWLERDLFKHMNTRCGRDVSPVHEIPPHRRNPNAKQSGSTARKKKVGDSKHDKKDDGKGCARNVESSAASSKSSPNIRRQSKTYSCAECYREFSRKDSLAKHLRVHSGEKPFECGVCKRAFGRSHHLIDHLRTHTGEQPYECGVCKKAFRRTQNLTSHLLIHTGEKPYECGVCDKAFIERTDLTSHLRIHTGEKPFECKVCKKAFGRSHDLTRHLRIHNGEKPFACDICKKTFRQKVHIRRHMNIHIPNKLTSARCARKCSTSDTFCPSIVKTMKQKINREVAESS